MSQSNDVEQWNFRDSTATSTDDQENFNKRDLDKLFERIPEGAMRESLVFAVNEMMKQGFIIKEFYLAQVRGDLLGAVLMLPCRLRNGGVLQGRPCELVFQHSESSETKVPPAATARAHTARFICAMRPHRALLEVRLQAGHAYRLRRF